MSYAYCRIPAKKKQSKLYGFEKVPVNKLPSIIARLQKTTCASSCFEPARANSGFCERVRNDIAPTPPQRHMSDRDLNKLVRRLRTPTISKLAAIGSLNPDYEARLRCETPLRLGTEEQRPKTTAEFRKFIKRITKATSSSRGKHYDLAVNDAELARLLLLDIKNGKLESKDVVDSIVQRLQTPTVASQPIHSVCPKRPQTVRCLTQKQRGQLPLVSGLPRSEGVDQIVERLYSGTSRSRPKTS
ncbi:hypothetical protein CAPTEDRAFT_227310 [Capitella teleta]|uniref:Uncharacterized protein n=1 Tax=Capitella teleta TaxID=283909 RepID=R7TRV3_CAPTE|nr:hypothetical protein CAPTEDRAFT_227310 [Capitella teleta]|eukprot:ELT96359.1 hypothetical protein CAPTEDRAFT_227310 [Capitella teleta]